MKEKLARVHASIGSAAAKYLYLFFQDFRQRFFKNLLYTDLAWLPLPAKITGAFITDVYEVAQIESFDAKLIIWSQTSRAFVIADRRDARQS